MALWKPLLGNRTSLDSVPKHSGHIYWCSDDGSLHFDYTDKDGVIKRKQINAKDCETILGMSLEDIQKSINYNDLSNKPDIPSKLPNPNKLTFTGAVTGEYDGSTATTINVPAVTGEPGESITITEIIQSNADGGENKVTFSDGNTLVVKNGNKGSQGIQGNPGNPGANGYTPYVGSNGNWFVNGADTGKPSRGEDGTDGYTPVKGTDYWTAADKQEVRDYAAAEITTHNSDTAAHADIRQQISQLSSEIVDEIIVMTQSAYSNMTQSDLADLYARGVRLIAVTDLTYTNLVPISTDTDGSIYNGTGYKDGVRLSSSGGISDLLQENSTTTGFIPFKNTDIIRVKGVIILGAYVNHNCHCYFNLYDSNKTFIDGGAIATGYNEFDSNITSQISITYDETTGITTFQIIDPDGGTGKFRSAAKGASYFRLNAIGKGADLIITVNEEI